MLRYTPHHPPTRNFDNQNIRSSHYQFRRFETGDAGQESNAGQDCPDTMLGIESGAVVCERAQRRVYFPIDLAVSRIPGALTSIRVAMGLTDDGLRRMSNGRKEFCLDGRSIGISRCSVSSRLIWIITGRRPRIHPLPPTSFWMISRPQQKYVHPFLVSCSGSH